MKIKTAISKDLDAVMDQIDVGDEVNHLRFHAWARSNVQASEVYGAEFKFNTKNKKDLAKRRFLFILVMLELG